MRTRQGVTLVELMIAVAMLGIMASGLGFATRHLQLVGIAELQQEQAMVLLAYHAQHRASGTIPSEDTLARLTTGLPDAQVLEVRSGAVTTLTVTWRDAYGGPAIQDLTVFAQ